jgi:hypothetical protein
MFLSTRKARAILKTEVGMSDFVWQTANLAGFIAGCFTNDLELIREGLNDVVIEPQRRKLIPGATAVRDAAMAAGAIGCSISGAGPSLFAWALVDTAEAVRQAMVEAFARNGIEVDDWVVALDSAGRPRRRRLTRMQFHSTRDPSLGPALPRRCARGWRRMAGCTSPSTGRNAMPTSRRRRPARWRSASGSSRPYAMRRPARAGTGRHHVRGLQLPGAARVARRGRSLQRAGAVPGSHGRVQGLWRAFPGGCFERINRGSGRVINILVATSGDTGGAVAAAFHRRPDCA